jgi:hypothetical protein
MSSLSDTATRCLDRQLQESINLLVSAKMLSDSFRAADDPLMAVALARLAAELSDQVAILLPLTAFGAETASSPNGVPPAPAADCEPGTDLAELGARLSHASLVAQTDAMEPGLEPIVAAALLGVAALYRTRRELLVVCTVVGSG